MFKNMMFSLQRARVMGLNVAELSLYVPCLWSIEEKSNLSGLLC